MTPDTPDGQEPVQYISYNGMGRSPMLWGIPYMAGLAVVCGFLIGGMLLGTFVAPSGWFFSLLGIPILIFFKVICETDDKAIRILFLEAKWRVISLMGGNAKWHGGTTTFAPTSYGRKLKHVKRYFKKTTGG